MGFILVESGYLDNEYLTSSYLAGVMHAYGAFQATLVIEDDQALALQATNQIVDQTDETAIQSTNTIESSAVVAFQSTKIIQATPSIAVQSFGDIQGFPAHQAIQAKQDTLVHKFHGYLESGYLEDPYLVELICAFLPIQASITINQETNIAIQSTNTIVDQQNQLAIQSNLIESQVTAVQTSIQIVDKESPLAIQATKVIDTQTVTALESGIIIEAVKQLAIQAKQDTLLHTFHGYLESGYLEDPYLVELICAFLGIQSSITIETSTNTAIQSTNTIVDKEVPIALESLNSIVDKENPFAFQADSIRAAFVAFQALATLYSTTNLRILCEFPSRGLGSVSNTFSGIADSTLSEFQHNLDFNLSQLNVRIYAGVQPNLTLVQDPVASGWTIAEKAGDERDIIQITTPASGGPHTFTVIISPINWTASTTATGDFNVSNLDTDVTEQKWRSTSNITQVLTNDTGVPQGVAIDTLAILSHNMTTSASVQLQGSSDPGFATIDTNLTLTVTVGDMYYIAEDLPNSGSRYWRLNINDPTNTNSYIEIGTVLFGTASTFQANCFRDEITFAEDDFVNSIRTEGQTNVALSRAIKRRIGLDFVDVSIDSREYQILDSLFKTFRTTHKCLWIPTPNPDSPAETARFAVFGKLEELPERIVNSKGPNNNHASFSVNVTEAK